MALAYMRGAVVVSEELQNTTSACCPTREQAASPSTMPPAHEDTAKQREKMAPPPVIVSFFTLVMSPGALVPCIAAALIDRAKGERLTELFTSVGTRSWGQGSWIKSHRKSEPKVDDRMPRRTCALHERREKQTEDLFWTLFGHVHQINEEDERRKAVLSVIV